MIIAISILIGIMPGFAIYKLWKWYEYNAFIVPILMDQLMQLSIALTTFSFSLQLARERFINAKSNLKPGGFVSGPTIQS
jgi:NhaP-type Na+/H+ or K+/H+ antiporter